MSKETASGRFSILFMLQVVVDFSCGANEWLPLVKVVGPTYFCQPLMQQLCVPPFIVQSNGNRVCDIA